MIFGRMHRIQDFLLGGGGRAVGPGLTVRKQPGKRFFIWFFSPQLILQFTEEVKWFYYRENFTFPRIQWVQLFPGGGGGDPKVNFNRNTHNL